MAEIDSKTTCFCLLAKAAEMVPNLVIIGILCCQYCRLSPQRCAIRMHTPWMDMVGQEACCMIACVRHGITESRYPSSPFHPCLFCLQIPRASSHAYWAMKQRALLRVWEKASPVSSLVTMSSHATRYPTCSRQVLHV